MGRFEDRFRIVTSDDDKNKVDISGRGATQASRFDEFLKKASPKAADARSSFYSQLSKDTTEPYQTNYTDIKRAETQKATKGFSDRLQNAVDNYNRYYEEGKGVGSLKPLMNMADRKKADDELKSLRSEIDTYYKSNMHTADKDYYQYMLDKIDEINGRYISFDSKVVNDYDRIVNNKEYAEQKKQAEDYQKLIGMDTEAAQNEINTLTEMLDKVEKADSSRPSVNEDYLNERANSTWDARARITAQRQIDNSNARNSAVDDAIGMILDGTGYTSSGELRNAIYNKTLELNTAKRLQKWQSLTDNARSNIGFQTFSQKGLAQINPVREKAKSLTEMQKNVEGTIFGAVSHSDDLLSEMFSQMTEDEWEIYAYYIGRGDESTANEYVQMLSDTLNARQAKDEFERNYKDNTLKEIAYGIANGFSQFGEGIDSFVDSITGKDNTPISTNAYKSELIRGDLYGDGGIGGTIARGAYDVLSTTSMMVPSIALGAVSGGLAGSSAVTSAVGALTMSVPSAGSSYAEYIRQGMNPSQARSMAYVQGAWEGLSEVALGGIENFGANQISKLAFKSATETAGKGFKRAFGKFIVDALQEGAEEVIQDYGSAIIESAWTGKYNAPEDVMYSFVLGALSAAMLNGASVGTGAIVNVADNVKLGNKLKEEGNLEYLKKAGSLFSADSVAYKLAGKVDENTGAYQIAKLLNSINANMSEQNINDITNALVEKGMSESDARTNAEWMARAATGEQLTAEQQKALDANDVLSKVFNEVIIEPNSTLNQRIVAAADANSTSEQRTVRQQMKEYIARREELEAEDRPVTDETTKEISPNEIISAYNKQSGYNQETENYVQGNYETYRQQNVSAEDYARANREAYRYGQVGYSDMANASFANILTEDQRREMYKQGRLASMRAVTAEENKINSAIANHDGARRTGKVHLSEAFNSLSEIQKGSIRVIARATADVYGTDVFFYKSHIDSKTGKRIVDEDLPGVKKGETAPNGLFDTKTGAIYIDLNAGAKGEGTMLYTFAHESTHFIRQYSPEMFDELTKAVLELRENTDFNLDETIKRYQMKSSQNLSRNEALEEFIADSMESMFTDGNALGRMEKMKTSHPKVWQALKDFFNKMYLKVKGLYSQIEKSRNYGPETEAGRYVLNMKASLEKINKLFAESAVKAGENYQALSSRSYNEKIQSSKNNKINITSEMTTSEINAIIRERFSIREEEAKYGAEGASQIIKRAGMVNRGRGTLRGWGDKAKTIALGIATDLIRDGKKDFRGTKLSGNKEEAVIQLATEFMVLRNPLFETFRLFYVKGDTIVGQEAFTSYVVDAALTGLYTNINDNANALKKSMDKFGADGYYIVHNHPSGNPRPSQEDVNVTKKYALAANGCKGHIVIDHNKFSFIEYNTESDTLNYKINEEITGNSGSVDFKQRVIDHPLLYKTINGPGVLAEMAVDLSKDKKASAVIYTNTAGEIILVREIENGFVASEKFEEFIKDDKKAIGALRAFIVTDSFDVFYNDKLEDFMTKNLLTDVVVNSNGIYDYASRNIDVNTIGSDYTPLGEFRSKIKSTQVEEKKINYESSFTNEDHDINVLEAKYEAFPTTKFSDRITDKKLIDFLENQEHITTYKAMLLLDGKLYPPMASKVKNEQGKYVMANPREVGEWMQATEDTANIKDFNKDGVGYYDLKKEDGGTVKAAYNPYEHSSNLVLNDQFEAAYSRPNIVTVKCEIPVSEMTSGYKAEHAKDSVGYLDWHSGVVAGKLKSNKRKVYLSRYLKVVEIMDNAEVAKMYKETLGDQDIAVPFNVVTPGLRTELEKVGVKIDENGTPGYQSLQKRKAEKNSVKFFERNSDWTLKAYSKQQLEDWENSKRIVLYQSEKDIDAFVERSLKTKDYNGKLYFGMVSDELANEMQQKFGENIRNYNCSLGAYEVRKIVKSHGNEKNEAFRGQRAIDPKIDFKQIPYVLSKPDVITYEGLYEGKPLYNLKRDEYTIAGVVSDKHFDLFVQTMYASNKKRSLATPSDEQASDNTPKATSGTAPNLTIPQNTEGVNSNTYKRSERDAEYLELAKNPEKNATKLQQMTDEAAKKAGYTERVYHGTVAKKLFNIFKSGSGQYGNGVYFTYDERLAKTYGNVMNLYVKVDKIATYDDAYEAVGVNNYENIDAFAKSMGYDSADEMYNDYANDPTSPVSNPDLIPKLVESGFDGFEDDGNGGFVLWDIPNFEVKIKLADAVTYDDNGNVIPLSKRFDSSSKDIRYSERETEDYIKKSTQKYGDVESAAVEHFGLTNDFRIAGYILRDGRMLDFSGAHWLEGASEAYISDWRKKNDIRQVDHEDIMEAFDIASGDFPSDSRKEFINRGNIRMSPEAPGINIAAEPTSSQYDVIRKLIEKNPYGESGFYVDIENKSKRVEKLTYSGKVNPEQVINDIKYYYANGSTRSSILQFHSSEYFSERNEEEIQRLQKVQEVLEKQNAKLKEDNAALKELLKLQGVETKGTMFTTGSLKKVASLIMAREGIKGESEGFVKLLGDAYKYLKETEDIDGFNERARTAAEWLSDRMTPEATTNEELQDLSNFFKNRTIYISPEMKSEIVHGYDSYRNFLNGLRGRVSFTQDRAKGTPIDVIMQEAADVFPQYFDADMSDKDMPAAIYDTVQMLIEESESLSKQELEYVKPLLIADAVEAISDGFWKLSTLRTVADRYADKIAKLKGEHNQRMTRLRNDLKAQVESITKKLKSEKSAALKAYKAESEAEISELKKKYAERISNIRAEKNQKIEDIKEMYLDRIKATQEKREKKAMIEKILKRVKALNSMLLNEDAKNHVTYSLKGITAEALSAINMTTIKDEERLAKLEKKIKETTDPAVLEQLWKYYDKVVNASERRKVDFDRLTDAYNEIKTSSDPRINAAYDEVISDMLEDVKSRVGTKPLIDMSMEELTEVNDLYKALMKKIKDANKAFRLKRFENILEASNAVMKEVKDITKNRTYAEFNGFINGFTWDNLKPEKAFSRIGSGTLTDLWHNVRNGEDTWAQDYQEARDFFMQKAKQYGYFDWDVEKPISIENADGDKIDMTLGELMSLYAYSKRDQALEHLEKGGVVHRKKTRTVKKFFKVTEADTAPYRIDSTAFDNIVKNLNANQKAFIDEMQDYLSSVMGAKGNEVSNLLYDIDLFKEKYYFPLKSASNYLKGSQNDSNDVLNAAKVNPKIKNKGFTKKLTKHANNPIILDNFMDVWAGHVNEMSMYHAFVPALEDLNRVITFVEQGNTGSVRATLEKAYGTHAMSYISTLLNDLNGGTRSDGRADVINRLTSLFKKGAVFASLSVVVQQPSAVARAWAYVNPKYFVQTALESFNIKKHSAEWEECKKYAPIARIKEMGYFDTHMGRGTIEWMTSQEYEGFAEKAKAVFKDAGYRDELLSKLPSLADEITWTHIWNAVKAEVKDTTQLTPGSEEFFKKCAERFNEVIVNTQVYDSVLSRSAYMRSKDSGMKMATAFMAEPTTSINMCADAIMQTKRGTMSKKQASRIIGSVVAQVILNSALVAIVYAARDDDDDKTYIEKYLKSLVEETKSGVNPLTMVPFLKDIVSLFEGYDVDRADMSAISSLIKAWKKLDSDNIDSYTKFETISGAVANMFGIPLKNLLRDARGVYNVVNDIASDKQTTALGVKQAIVEGLTGENATKQDKNNLLSALEGNDLAEIKKASQEWLELKIKQGKSEKDAKSAIQTAITTEWKPRFQQAYLDKDNEEMARIRKAINAAGIYKDVVKTTQQWIKDIKK